MDREEGRETGRGGGIRKEEGEKYGGGGGRGEGGTGGGDVMKTGREGKKGE